MLLNCLYIKEIEDKGRGVFTEKNIETGTIIEIAPVLVFSLKDTDLIKQTSLYDYYFMWSETEEIAAIALGYGSIYNHSFSPNTRYETYYEDKKIHFITIKDIAAGEEICINYNHDPENTSPVWFEMKK
jgi:SET domain-containing protein